MKQYLDAVREVMEVGTRKENRTGVDTLSTFNINYEIDMADGFPLLTTKKIDWKNIVVENLWFLSGEPKIDLLQKHGCKFWDDWADEEGRVPSAYGNFWRRFPVAIEDNSSPHDHVGYNDQIRWVLQELKRNPMSRRLVVSAWAPGNAQTSKLPPCHTLFVMNVQNTKDGPTLNLHLTQRSCDIALGVPYNIAGYALILELFAKFAGLKAGIFAHTLVDAHIYTCKPNGDMSEYDHLPGLREQVSRAPRKLPTLKISNNVKDLDDVERLMKEDTATIMKHFELLNYEPHPFIKFKVAV